MAQKKRAAAPATKSENGVKKPAGNKRGPKAKAAQVDEEVLATQTQTRQSKKKLEQQVEQSEDESDSEEEQSVIKFEDGSDSEEEKVGDLIDDEAVEDDDEDSGDDDDEDEDEDEDAEDEPGQVSNSGKQLADSDDDAPAEAPIAKKGKAAAPTAAAAASPKKGGIPSITVGKIPADIPKDQIIHVSNIPNEYKHLDLVALFTKFGPLAAVNRIKGKTEGNTVFIAFETSAAAEAALEAKEKALTFYGNVLVVGRPFNKDDLNNRTVAVALIGPKTTKEQLSAFFGKVGDVEAVNLSNNRSNPTAFVRFKSVDSMPKALKLHGSELNSRFITVREPSYKLNSKKSPERTLIVENGGKHESFKSDTIEKIFKKFGDIVDIDVVCTNHVLAFVSFKEPEQAAKALQQLNGKTVSDLELKLEQYTFNTSPRTVLVTNLAADVTESDLQELFSESGKIDNVTLLSHKALVKFATNDGFCKSFLSNERILKNQPVFLEPNSMLKHKLLKKKSTLNRNGNRKPGAPGGDGPPKFNKFGKKPFNKRPAQDNGAKPAWKKVKREA
ncbi:DNA-binding protein modulo [Drosophila obscura]|uniref:DNA-binding protein modulo n=1 Tax=Drosophila obscura TaxID=7282 RepID=UPI000BA05058|nr:DNA-binding protein modulo [Drosophila obscura]XP_022227063.1 DNA-binding protein modulo [Drosophila obscura]